MEMWFDKKIRECLLFILHVFQYKFKTCLTKVGQFYQKKKVLKCNDVHFKKNVHLYMYLQMVKHDGTPGLY